MLCCKKFHLIAVVTVFFILSACQLQDPKKTHGITFLDNRSSKLIINQTNKNDVIRIIGLPQIKDENNENNWIYLERILSKGKYHELGKHKLEENNVLLLNFDKYGILENKKLLTKEDINKLKFSNETTQNDLTKKSFIQSFLQSVKQKMYSNKR